MSNREDTSAPWPSNPWLLYLTEGHATPCVNGDDWLAEWTRRVRKIEFGDGTPQQRCAAFDRLLAVNAPAFRTIIQHGLVGTALDATEEVIKTICTC
jgi:hypothetical protein